MLKYDDVLNKQREVIYAERRGVLEGDDLREEILEWIDEVRRGRRDGAQRVELPPRSGTSTGSSPGSTRSSRCRSTRTGSARSRSSSARSCSTQCIADAHLAYERKESELTATPGLDPDIMRQLERFFLLQVIDAHWREHLDTMDYLREGIHLRAMAQKDPLVEYRVEGHGMFEEMMAGVREEVVSMLFHVEVTAQDADLERPHDDGLIYDGGGSESYAAGSSTLDAHAGGHRRLVEHHGAQREPTAHRRSVATTRARAAPARSTSAATGSLHRCARRASSRPLPRS